MIDFIAIGIIVAITVFLVVKMIRDQKSGKSNCGCGCGCDHHKEQD